MADYCTVAEVKALLNANESSDDALLAALVTRASGMVDVFTRRTFAERDETRYYTPNEDTDGRELLLDDDLLSVTTLTNGDGAVLSADDYKLFPLNRSPKNRILLLSSSGHSWEYEDDIEGAISVAGSWGYCLAAERPADLTQATARLALWLYRQREAPFEVVGNRFTGEYIVPVALPADIKAMLLRYRRLVWGAV